MDILDQNMSFFLISKDFIMSLW